MLIMIVSVIILGSGFALSGLGIFLFARYLFAEDTAAIILAPDVYSVDGDVVKDTAWNIVHLHKSAKTGDVVHIRIGRKSRRVVPNIVSILILILCGGGLSLIGYVCIVLTSNIIMLI